MLLHLSEEELMYVFSQNLKKTCEQFFNECLVNADNWLRNSLLKFDDDPDTGQIFTCDHR